MNAIDKYMAAKREAGYCSGWAALLGQRYHGGGGGIGALVSLKLSAATIYHQYSDGAKNYHECPASLLPHLEAEIKSQFTSILDGALARQAEAIQRLAKDAADEHVDLMRAAGMSLTEAPQ